MRSYQREHEIEMKSFKAVPLHRNALLWFVNFIQITKQTKQKDKTIQCFCLLFAYRQYDIQKDRENVEARGGRALV